jgi:predicted Rossmann-fold nucleotide-binding protein
MRKLWFAHTACAMIAFPGGFGTIEEMFEILMLQQTEKLDRKIVMLLYGSQYWREVIDFDALVRHGTIDPDDVELFTFVDDPATALQTLQAALLPAAPQKLSGQAAATNTPAFAPSRRKNGRNGRSG